MTRPLIIQGWEHKVNFTTQEEFDCQKYLGKCIAGYKGGERKILGLHKKGDDFAPGNYIGMVWLDEDDNRVLRVDSKFSSMDYIAMYAECMAHPIVSDRTAKCLHVGTEEKFIDIGGRNFSVLIVITYLCELNKFCQRQMRRHFTHERQNFVGKMKGKILFSENLRRNIIRARPDRIYCEYQSVSNDILENQILRAALERASRFFNEYRGDKKVLDALPQWIRASRAVLNDVSIKKIKSSDFAVARKHGTFAPYKNPLALAKLILQTLGPNPQAEISHTKTPPFSLASDRLFERYAEMKLRESSPNIVTPQDTDTIDAGAFNVAVRPDFYDNDKTPPRIIDAKYKKLNLANMEQADIYQIIAYSQHRGLLNQMECERDSIQLGLAYPSVNGSDKIIDNKVSQAFFPDIVVYEIPCPIKHNENN